MRAWSEVPRARETGLGQQVKIEEYGKPLSGHPHTPAATVYGFVSLGHRR